MESFLKIEFRPEDKSITRKIWTSAGVMHLDNDPAYTEYCSNGTVVWKKWYTHGNLNRVQKFDKREKLVLDAWFQDGKRHREDGPALTTYEKIGREILLRRRWYKYGVECRDDGPSDIMTDSLGQVYWEIAGTQIFHHSKRKYL